MPAPTAPVQPSSNPLPTPPITDVPPMGADLVPQAVKDNAARADALQAALIAGTLNQPEVPPAEPVVVAPPPAPIPPAPVVAAPPAPLAPPPAETPVEQLLAMNPNDANEEMFGRLQHAYRSLHGRAVAHRQRDGERVITLEAEIARLRAAPPPAAPVVIPPPAAPLSVDELFTEDERANFGEDLLQTFQRAAERIADGRVAAFQAQVAPQLQQVTNATAAQREERVVQHLDAMLQPWGIPYFGPNGAGGLNEDPGFLAWLELTDAMTGAKRGALLGSAWQAQDGNRMWGVCSTYLNEVAPRPSSSEPVPPPAPPAPAPKVPLASLAAPGTAPRPTTQPVGSQVESKEIFTRQAVNEFYAKKRRGEFAGHDAEVAETERAIAEASRENRII